MQLCTQLQSGCSAAQTLYKFARANSLGHSCTPLQSPRDSRRSQRYKCSAFSTPSSIQESDKKRSLLRFVQEVQASDVLEEFQKSQPAQVLAAMGTTVTNMLGTLPPRVFHSRTSANAEDMAQMTYSLMMTGYMYRNAQFRLEVEHISRIHYDEDSGPSSSKQAQDSFDNRKDCDLYAPGTQLSRVSGDVVRWRKDTEETEFLPAQTYIKKLEQEIKDLRERIPRDIYIAGLGNELLDYIRVQEQDVLHELTRHASEAVCEAMNSFVQRLMGSNSHKVDMTHPELARIFYYSLVVGYILRELEHKFDMESRFTVRSLAGSFDSPD